MKTGTGTPFPDIQKVEHPFIMKVIYTTNMIDTVTSVIPSGETTPNDTRFFASRLE